MMRTTVSSRGQTAVPSEVRKRFNLTENSRLEWIRPARSRAFLPRFAARQVLRRSAAAGAEARAVPWLSRSGIPWTHPPSSPHRLLHGRSGRRPVRGLLGAAARGRIEAYASFMT